jgi:hypothetical protein
VPRLAACHAVAVVLALGAALASGCDGPLGGSDAGPAAECFPDLTYLDAPFASIGPLGDSAPTEPSFVRPVGASFVWSWAMPWDRSSTYQQWLVDEQPFQVRLRFRLGTDYDPGGVIRLHMFIDGQAVGFGADAATETQIPLIDGLAEHAFEIPADQFPLGLSVVHIRYDVYQGRFSGQGYDVVMEPVTVFRASTEPRTTFEDTPGYSLEAADPGYFTTAHDVGFDIPFRYVTWPPVGGTYHFILNVQATPSLARCPNLTDTLAIVALLDGRPIDFTPQGPRIVATLRPDERRVFDVEIRNLPMDGARHHLDILQLSGLGHPSLARAGFTPWAVALPYGVAQAEWE